MAVFNLIYTPLFLSGFIKQKVQVKSLHFIVLSLTLFNLWGFASYFYAANKVEVLIESFRITTLLLSLIYISFSLYSMSSSARWISSLFVVSLFLEVMVFLLPNLEIYTELGTLNRNVLYKGISTNVNITAFSIAYKLPFLIYFLKVNTNKLLHYAVILLLFLSLLSITLLGTRGALLSILFIGVIFVLAYIFNKDKNAFSFHLKVYLIPLLLAFLTNYSLLSNELRSTQRIASISNLEQDGSIKQRLDYYTYSLKELIANPIVGLGMGNWKIASIEEDLSRRRTYIVPYHSHNDFLQIGAELGIFGLLLYVAFFGFTLVGLFKQYLIEKPQREFIFACLLFMLVYFIDANLNFPLARPINQIPLLFIVGYVLKDQLFCKTMTEFNKSFSLLASSLIVWGLIFTQPFVLYSHYRVHNSFIQQRKLLKDFNALDFSEIPEDIDDYEDNYPNVGVTTIPLKVLKGMYFAKSSPDKAIALAKASIKDNPYLYFSESYLAVLYSNKGELDSAFYFANKAYKNAPTIDLHAATYLPFLSLKKDTTALEDVSGFLEKTESEFIWSRYIETLLSIKDSLSDSDRKLIEKASKKFPKFNFFKSINSTKNYTIKKLREADSLAKLAKAKFENQEFLKARTLYLKASKLIPSEPAYVENIARSYMRDKDFDQAIVYFEKLITEHNIQTGLPEYFIGGIYYQIGESEIGCNYLLKAMEKNFSQAKGLYSQLCFKK